MDRSSVSSLLLPAANVSAGLYSQRHGARAAVAVGDVSLLIMTSVVQLRQRDSTSGDRRKRAGFELEETL